MAKTRITMGVVGQIASSMLTEAQFQSINGSSWVLMDGRSVAGSAYATLTGSITIPDARGMVLRGKNNGRSDGNQNPDGDSALGLYQGDAFGSHVHTSTPIQVGGGTFTAAGNYLGQNGPTVAGPGTQGAGGNETRMKNITVNHFIKIN